MRVRAFLVLAALGWPAATAAQETFRALTSCDRIELGLESVAVGADLSGVRSYYQGRVTLFAIDRVEPACCAFGVAIVMPDEPSAEAPEGMRCWAKWGFAGVDLRRAQARYDRGRGLTLTIPTREYDPETGGTSPGAPIRLRIDAGRGTIVDLDPPASRPR